MLSRLPEIVIGVLALFFVYEFVKDYISATGSFLSKVLAAAKGSITLLWARFQVVVVAGVSGLVYAADFLNAPNVATVIQTYLTPKTVAILMVASAVVTEWARRRKVAVTPAALSAPLPTPGA